MTIQQARENLGKPFKLSWLTGTGGAAAFDTIRSVSEDGWIYGDWLSAPCDDCRLKQDQPEQLLLANKNKQNDGTKIESGNV